MRIWTKQRIHFITPLFIVGFILNFVWEWVQCSPFFRHLVSIPTLGSMFSAAFGDVALMAVAFVLVSVWVGELNWFTRSLNSTSIFRIASVSLVLAFLVESAALISGRWAYTERNPILPFFGVSILPILQAVLINLISFWISKKITLALGNRETQTTEAI